MYLWKSSRGKRKVELGIIKASNQSFLDPGGFETENAWGLNGKPEESQEKKCWISGATHNVSFNEKGGAEIGRVNPPIAFSPNS